MNFSKIILPWLINNKFKFCWFYSFDCIGIVNAAGLDFRPLKKPTT